MSRGGEKSIWRQHPCLLGVAMVGKDQYGSITSAFLGVPMVGKHQYCYITPGLLGVPMMGKDQCGYITPDFSVSPQWGNINMRTSCTPAVLVGCRVLGRGAEPLVRTQFSEHPPSLNFGANHLKKWIQHPQKPPIPFLSPHNPHHRGGFFGGGGGQRVRAQLEHS